MCGPRPACSAPRLEAPPRSPPFALAWLLSALGCTLAGTYTPELGTSGLAWDAEDSGALVEVPVPIDTGIGPGTDGTDGGGAAATTVTAIPPGGTVPCAAGDPARPVSLSIQNNLEVDVVVFTVDDACQELSRGTAPRGAALDLSTQVGASLLLRSVVDNSALYSIVVGDAGGAVVLP